VRRLAVWRPCTHSVGSGSAAAPLPQTLIRPRTRRLMRRLISPPHTDTQVTIIAVKALMHLHVGWVGSACGASPWVHTDS
jgi:hypothetical protein